MMGAVERNPAMAYVRQRKQKDGTVRFYARYLGADGQYHEEDGYTSRRDAEKAGANREQDAIRGDWSSPASGRLSFKQYRDLLLADHRLFGGLHPDQIPQQSPPALHPGLRVD